MKENIEVLRARALENRLEREVIQVTLRPNAMRKVPLVFKIHVDDVEAWKKELSKKDIAYEMKSLSTEYDDNGIFQGSVHKEDE